MSGLATAFGYHVIFSNEYNSLTKLKKEIKISKEDIKAKENYLQGAIDLDKFTRGIGSSDDMSKIRDEQYFFIQGKKDSISAAKNRQYSLQHEADSLQDKLNSGLSNVLFSWGYFL